MPTTSRPIELTITILAEDTAGKMGTVGEHGFAALLEITYAGGVQKKLLFDTGTSGAGLQQNRQALKKDLHDLDCVVFSHGHYDHVWGITGILPLANDDAFLFCHPSALANKWVQDDQDSPDSISLEKVISPDELARQITVRTSREPEQLLPGIFTTGEIPRLNAFEKISGGLLAIRTHDSAGEVVVDMIEDDLSLLVQFADESVVIITGCCHAGLVNTLHHAASIIDTQTIRGIVGGLHLHDASQDRLDFTTQELGKAAVGELAACHCTGSKGVFALKSAFGERVKDVRVGSIFEYKV